MKVVILSDYFDDRGGAVGVARATAFGLQALGHDVNVITTIQEKASTGKKNIGGVGIFYIYSDYDLFWRAYAGLYNRETIKSIAKIFAEIKPDVIHAHNVHTRISYHALKLAKKTGAKVFLTVHDAMLFHYGKITEFIDKNDLSCPKEFDYRVSVWRQIKKAGKTYNPFRNFIIRRYLKYVDKIFAVSFALKKALNDNGIGNVEVIYNGINVGNFEISPELIFDFIKKYNLENKKTVLFGGRIGKEKGMMMMMAMRKVAKAAPQAILFVAAKVDETAENMLKMAREWNIENKIIISGWLSGDELKTAYWASDTVVVPSVYFDSCPLINMEAMACKKPIVATCFGGSREVVIDDETGYIVNPFNTEMLADKIIDLLEDPEKARAFGEKGYERVKNEFNLEKMINNYLKWYGK